MTSWSGFILGIFLGYFAPLGVLCWVGRVKSWAEADRLAKAYGMGRRRRLLRFIYDVILFP